MSNVFLICDPIWEYEMWAFTLHLFTTGWVNEIISRIWVFKCLIKNLLMLVNPF